MTWSPFDRAGLAPAEYGEIRLEETHVLSLTWRGRELESAIRSLDSGGCARVLSGTGCGFVSFTEMEMAAALRKAREHARMTDRGGPLPFAPAPPVRASVTASPAVPFSEIPYGEKVAALSRYHQRIWQSHPSIGGALVYYREARSRTTFLNSEGSHVEQERMDLTLQMNAVATANGLSMVNGVSVGSPGCFTVTTGLEAELDEACRTAVDLLAAPLIESGTYDVICDPLLAGTWAHETLGHLGEADHQIGDVQVLTSLAPATRVASELLTLCDSGCDRTARGGLAYDDEGVPSRDVLLLDRGVVRGRLHTRQTAGLLGEQPTGNARAVSYRFPPIPRMRNTRLEAGPHSLAEMVRSTERGLLACGFHGGQTDRTSFTFAPASCRLIEDGTVKHLVRGGALSGDVLDTVRRVDMVGKDLCGRDTSASCKKQDQGPLPVSFWAPHIRIREMYVAGGR